MTTSVALPLTGYLTRRGVKTFHLEPTPSHEGKELAGLIIAGPARALVRRGLEPCQACLKALSPEALAWLQGKPLDPTAEYEATEDPAAAPGPPGGPQTKPKKKGRAVKDQPQA